MTMIPVIRDDARGAALLDEQILDTALAMAEEGGWKAVTLPQVAARLGIPASRVLEHFRDLNAVADAWFGHGLKAMLADNPAGFADWPASERLEHCLMAWFTAMARHRRVTVEMLCSKAHLPHPHTWVPMVFDLSRLIQWLRQAAFLEAPYGSRHARAEEVGLTLLFLATLSTWSRDTAHDLHATRQALHKRLACCAWLVR
ncbi:TetR/AcrR family transcriptional regulator [Halomonas urmiana]|uniref:TetR/AcrR family transcriptional regulator n=1 Tax=Halomonas urmiana TaxID=490901 RepID=A0A5R8MGR7_9GAMM|nr:TetR/AcrR family transcriptional regulator [Halomonas urmiana]TLF50397.1 TetR/AcrR family transcriptional regulator [Halomonas urmiana]